MAHDMSKNVPSQRQVVSTGLPVDDADKLTRDCAKAIGASLQPLQKGLSFTPIAGRQGDRSLYTLISTLATNAEEKYRYKVIPLVELNSRIYWLTVSLEFRSEQGISYLISVSIFVFEGNASDEKKTPLIRAEWGCLPDDVQGPHAQPHWHIYPSRLNRSRVSQLTFEADPDVQVFSPSDGLNSLVVQDFGQTETTFEDEEQEVEWERAEKFHFAMAARWHDGTATLNQPPVLDQIPKWLSGCIDYTLKQFRYIYKTKHTSALG